jgi:hypothetical protein
LLGPPLAWPLGSAKKLRADPQKIRMRANGGTARLLGNETSSATYTFFFVTDRRSVDRTAGESLAALDAPSCTLSAVKVKYGKQPAKKAR